MKLGKQISRTDLIPDCKNTHTVYRHLCGYTDINNISRI